MRASLERKFIRALELCQSLVNYKCQPSSLPCQAIELLCEVGREPSVLLDLINRHPQQTQQALITINQYARSADNWRLKDSDCSLGFGVKDHCSILIFLFNYHPFKSFTGNFNSPEIICQLLKDWKGIDLTILLFQDSPQLVTDSSK
jgi:hypothetical protein